jgi:uncharacterized membrane protein YciS (DUF1049 family)
MKFKIIASLIVIAIIIVALFIKAGSNNNQSVDENGNPIETTQQQ